MEAREAAFLAALSDVIEFLDGGGRIAILDATNSTQSRRQRVAKFVAEKGRSYSVLFLESICDDEQVLEANMRSKVSNSPDFAHMTPQEALADLKLRIKNYEDVYETVQDHEGAFIKLYNLSSKVMANHCYGRVAKSILPYLMAIHIGGRPIFLARAGPGEDMPDGRLNGSDRISNLSAAGRSFAASLAGFVNDRVDSYYAKAGRVKEAPHVITSTVQRAIASVSFMCSPHEETSALNPIDKGAIGAGWWDVECAAGLPPWEELEKRHPEFVSRLKKSPLECRFPGGESYLDVIRRLESLLIEVEKSTTPELIVTHHTVQQ
jgi:broad specificity phosphatase PhoE